MRGRFSRTPSATRLSPGFARKLLVVVGLYLALQTALGFALYLHSLGGGDRFGADFICFWQAGQRAQMGAFRAIYDAASWRGALAAPVAQFAWFVYPPFSLFALQPLGSMSYGQAVAWWSVLPLPFYLGLTLGLARRSDAALARDRASPGQGLGWLGKLILVAMTTAFLAANLLCGQTGALIAILWLATAWFWPRRPLVAGLCIGLMAIKPQLGLLLPVALIAAGRWRTFAAAAVTVASLVAASWAWVGSAVWRDYLQMTQLFSRYIGTGHGRLGQLALAPYVSLQGAGLPIAGAALAQALVSVVVVACVVAVFLTRRAADQGQAGDGPPHMDLRLGILAAGALLATPYALTYDTPLLALAVIPLFVRAWRGEWDGWELAALTLLVVTPYMQQIAPEHLPFGVGALAATFVVLARRYLRETASAPLGAQVRHARPPGSPVRRSMSTSPAVAGGSACENESRRSPGR